MHFPEGDSGSGGLASKDFVRLKDKESIIGVFRGDPHSFKQHWKDKKSTPCTGTGCLLCQDKDPKTAKAGFRFRLNFITRENGEYVCKIFEQSWAVYLDLKTLHSDYPLNKHVVKITRNGSDNTTRYNIMPQPNGLIKPEVEAQISKIQLKDLVNLPESSTLTPHQKEDLDNNYSHTPSKYTDDDIPF